MLSAISLPPWLRRCAAGCLVALGWAVPAAASDWAVDPVRLDLSPQQPTAVLQVRNNSEQATTIQITAVAWSQLSGKEVYTPTRELLVSPPAFTVAAKAEQVVRVALRRTADPASELSYRINLQEIPPPPAPGFVGLQVALRVGLPVFVQPLTGKASPKAVWTAAALDDKRIKVVLENQGNAHLQVSDFALYVPGAEQAIARESGLSYALAGQAREWILSIKSPKLPPNQRFRLKAYTDAGEIETELVLNQP